MDKILSPEITALSILVAIGTLDLLVPLGVAVGALYVVAISTLRGASENHIKIFTGVAVALTFIVYFITLADTTNWMALVNRIISSVAILLIAWITVQRHRVSNRLEKNMMELQRKNKELRNFTYIASHDLQEPIRTIRNFSRLLSERHLGSMDQRGREALQFVEESAERMSALVTALLDYSRLGKSSPIEPVDLNEVINEILIDLAATMEEANAKLDIARLPTVPGMRTELRVLLQNLISNALKFVDEGCQPQIQITSTSIENGWQISIRDSGIGIASKEIPKIFALFSRLHGRDKYDGTGIGLSHCRRIVEIHGGSIDVDSEVGVGSTFHFTLMNPVADNANADKDHVD